VFLGCSRAVHAQATVNEGLETAVVYVDAANGSDSNSGTQDSPFQTINKALAVANANNNNGIGTKIIVNPGTYREALSEQSTNTTTPLPITIEAATPGTAVLSGADIFTGWTQYSGNPSIYTVPWTQNFGFCAPDTQSGAPYQAPIMLRREAVFINGVLMTQVLDISQMLYPGSFYVDDAGQTMYVWPPSGVDINSATVEISTRAPELSITGYANFVLRGMTVQYDSSCHNHAAVLVTGGSSNILLDSDIIQWNNAKGLNFQTSVNSTPTQNITVQDSQFLHNGEMGATDFRLVNALWQNNTYGYTNWRGSLGSYYTWDAAGMYYDQEHNSTVNNPTVMYNQCIGIHWDTDNDNVVATAPLVYGNMLIGIFFEKNEGPITLTGATIANNDPNPAVALNGGGGVVFRNSEGILIENNQVFGNGNAQVAIEGQLGGIRIQNWQTGQNYDLLSSALTFNQNVFEAVGAVSSTFSDPELGGTDWLDYFAPPYISTNNIWWNTQGNPAPFVVPAPNLSTTLDFLGWQLATLQDVIGSTYQEPVPDPALTFIQPPPDYPDYWLVVNNSTVSAAPDGTASFTVNSIPVGSSFNGNISLSLVGLNNTTGITGTITANSIGTPGSAVVTLAAAKSVPAGDYQATVIGNNGNLTHAVTFTIIVPSTFVRIVPATLAFPPTPSGISSSPMTTILTNNGTTTLTITSIVLSSQWTETDNCDGAVPAGQSCTLSVIFTPNGTSTFTGTMTLTDSDPTGMQIVNLTGSGTANPTVTLDPTMLSYGNITVGTDSILTSLLTNTGTATLTITNQAFGGNDPGDFSESDNCDGMLAAGASCTITITFAPQVGGGRSATYTLTDNAVSSTQTLTLQGTGLTPTVQLIPGTLAFGAVSLGLTETLSSTLTNSGTGALLLSSISISGANSSDFTQTNTCGASLPAGGTCTISVTFAPAANGSADASLSVADNALNSPQTVALTGSGGVSVSLSPSPLHFGPEPVGKPTPAFSVTVTNNLGVILVISSQSITGADPGDFVIAKSCQSMLGPGQSCVIGVVFNPLATGLRNANLSLTTSAPGSPQIDTLKGYGTLLAAQLSPTSLDFGTVSVGTTSPPQTITMTNTGNLSLAINGFSFTGTHQSWFSQTNTCGTSLATGATCTISVTVTPKSQNTAAVTLNVSDAAPNSPQQASLTATGN
jgi:hypothetical protein